jgi:type VI secretion system secreted protein VgrG
VGTPSFTQENRLISLATPLGDDVLLLQGFTGNESISRLFRFHLDLFSTNDSISFDDIVGQQVTISVSLVDGSARYFNGYVSRFAQSGADESFTRYQMEVVPWLWFLTRTANCKIFQNMKIPDIIQEVFGDYDAANFQLSLTGDYDPREYCVQYRETDFNFVSRLMEEYGIFYFFQHDNGKHTMVLGDSQSVFQACPGQETARYDAATGVLDATDVINTWNMEQELRTGKYSLTDYNFETPSTSLLSSEPTVVDVGGNSSYEIFDYPGIFLDQPSGTTQVQTRMQEEETTSIVATGSSVCRSFTSGYTFELQEHFRDDANTTYLLTEVQHVASVGGSYMSNGGSGASYSNHFSCMPAKTKVQFRPARLTPKPFVQGPQTAVVVGPKQEEIWVDNYGRVKVQFFWDRLGQNDENSSCWIRPSQPWAGGNWGGMWIPRIGQEVIISFLEGDPDRPIITGRVYNAGQMPPYTLPDHQTVSTFQSRSSKGGGSSNFNEMRFEDKMGSEQIFINAEKEMDLRVETNSREFIGASRHLVVTNDQIEQVGAQGGDKHGHVKGNHFEQIDSDMSLTVKGKQMENTSGDKSTNVGGDFKELVTGNASLQVGQNQKEQVGGDVSLQITGNRQEQVGQNYNVSATMAINLAGGMSVNIQGGSEGVSITGPGGFISITAAGVAIQGTMVLINSGGSSTPAQSPSPASPDSPDAPTAPKDPDTADDGSKFGKLN